MSITVKPVTPDFVAEISGIDLALPPAALRHRLDSKLVTTRLGNEAGVPSVPNVLGSVTHGDGAPTTLRPGALLVRVPSQ